MVKAANRRVTFLPHCQVREFGNTEVESDGGNPSTVESMGYTARWLESMPVTPFPTVDWVDNKTNYNVLDVSKIALDRTREFPPVGTPKVPRIGRPLRRQQAQVPLLTKSQQRLLEKIVEDPVHRNALVMLANNISRMEQQKSEEALAKTLKKNHGVLWKKPTALREIRMDWRFKDEFESDGANPGDTEMDASSPKADRKKKLLTVKERFQRQVAMRKAIQQRKDEALRKMFGKKNLKNFIEKAKAGIHLRSIASKDNDDTSDRRFAYFAEARAIFVAGNKRDPRKLDFRVKAHINRRLSDPDVDSKVKIAYQVVLENYDPVLGPHFYYMFQHKNQNKFLELEKLFLLNR